MKEQLIEEIKSLISTSKKDNIEINPNYLEYFQEDELIEIKEQLILKKQNISQTSGSYLDEIYEKTKKE